MTHCAVLTPAGFSRPCAVRRFAIPGAAAWKAGLRSMLAIGLASFTDRTLAGSLSLGVHSSTVR
jgi:hypothetical protein